MTQLERHHSNPVKPVGVSEWEPRRWATLGNFFGFTACWTLTVVILCAMAWR